MSHTQHLPPEHHEPDAWHRHTADEGLPQIEHGSSVNVTSLSVIFVAMTLFVVVSVAALIVYFDRHTRSLRQTGLETTTEAAEYALPYRQQATDQLGGFGWSADGTHIRMPVDLAKQQIIVRYGHGGGH